MVEATEPEVAAGGLQQPIDSQLNLLQDPGTDAGNGVGHGKVMRELKDELASLRIDRDAPRRTRWRVPVVLLVLVALAVAGWYYFGKVKTVLGAVEVETVTSRVESSSGPNAGTPILTASGYLVARKQSVVSSKIQGRISRLLVEEGSVVKAGEVLATLDDADVVAAIAKAKADIEYAKADLAEAQRQERLQEDLYRSKVVSQDALDAAKAKVNLAAAAIEQDKANLQVQEAYLDFTTVRAPFAGVVVKKMTEAGRASRRFRRASTSRPRRAPSSPSPT